MAATLPPFSRAHVVLRIAAAVLGGWVFVWGLTTFGIALGVAAGMDYDDARMLLYLVAFLVFLVVFCWTFAASSLKRVWLVLAGGGALMTAAAWFLIQTAG